MSTEEQPKIVVYSTPLCAPCEALKRFLTENGVPFVNKDLMMDEEAAELIESHNIRTSPVLGVGDDLYAGKALERDNLVEVFGL
jgi:glutaredoxin